MLEIINKVYILVLWNNLVKPSHSKSLYKHFCLSYDLGTETNRCTHLMVLPHYVASAHLPSSKIGSETLHRQSGPKLQTVVHVYEQLG